MPRKKHCKVVEMEVLLVHVEITCLMSLLELYNAGHGYIVDQSFILIS